MKFIDLFAGIGGFHIALHNLDAECVFASEIDPHARKTYEHNMRPRSPKLFDNGNFNDDIMKITDPKNQIPDFDILCAGFPCQSPSSATKVAEFLSSLDAFSSNSELDSALDWIRKEYHPDWTFYKALSRGIGIHHGAIPRALQQQCINWFNSGVIKVLVCTSTFIEGVNSDARSIIIYDSKIANKKLDSFTYRNIEGRVGRMFKHFVGSVYSLQDPPKEGEMSVDFPICRQDQETSIDLLLQIDRASLTDGSKERLDGVFSKSYLPDYIIKKNIPLSRDKQERLALEIHNNIEELEPLLIWSGTPNYEQLLRVCQFMIEYISQPKSIANAGQLGAVIRSFFTAGSYSSFLKKQINEPYNGDVNFSIDNALNHIKNVITYYFPRNLMILETLIKYVFERNNRECNIDYSFYAARLENLSLPPAIYALDEYGIPIQLVEKIQKYIKHKDSLDMVLSDISKIPLGKIELSDFEMKILLGFK